MTHSACANRGVTSVGTESTVHRANLDRPPWVLPHWRSMILHVNHIVPGGPEQAVLAERGADIVRMLLGLVGDGAIEPRLVPSLRVHLDWIQYKANFREPVLVRRAADRSGGPLALAELAVDLRRVDPTALREALARAL